MHTGVMRVAAEPSLRREDYPFTHPIRVRFESEGSFDELTP